MNNRRKQLMLASAKEYCKCVVEGKTLKYNQIANILNDSGTYYGMSYSSNTNGTITISGTSNYIGGDSNIYTIIANFTQKVGHKLLCYSTSSIFQILLYDNHGNYVDYQRQYAYIVPCQYDEDMYASIMPYDIDLISNGTTINETFKVMIIDLTELGLDNINSIVDFYNTDLGKYIAKDNYLPYEPNGKFIHAQSPINFEGVNIWNEQWELGYIDDSNGQNVSGNDWIRSKDYINVKPNTEYYFLKPYSDVNMDIYFYDKNKSLIKHEILRTNITTISPSNAKYLRFYLNDDYGTTYNHDICINEYNPLYNGKYYKYCGNSVFESGLTLYKGDTYKTYGIDEISYNNLTINSSFKNTNSWYGKNGSISVAGGELVYTCTTIGTYAYDNVVYQNYFTYFANALVEGHKYLLLGQVKANTNATLLAWLAGAGTEIATNRNIQINANVWTYAWVIKTAGSGNVEGQFGIDMRNAQVGDTYSVKNAMLFDLTALGLENVNSLIDFSKTKLCMFLLKGYCLPFATSNRKIKDQIVRTFKEIDLSSLTWQNYAGVYYVALPKDIKLNGQAIAEKYANDDVWIAEYPYDDMNLIVRTDTTPSGKALLELATPEIITDYPMDFVLSNDNLSYEDSFFSLNGTIFDLPNGLIPVLENGIPKLEIIGDEIGFVGIEYGNTPYPAKEDVYFANGFRMSSNQIAFTTTNNDGSNVNNYDEREFLIGKTLRVWVTTPRDIPDIMISRRTINVESDNGVDLDFTKE